MPPAPVSAWTIPSGPSALYVSAEALGEVSVLTTRKSRTLAWIGTIPHWFYFAALRRNQPVWYPGRRRGHRRSAASSPFSVSRWASPNSMVNAPRPDDQLVVAIPYSGWMRWHYITGSIFGVFTLTWVFSGHVVDGTVRLGHQSGTHDSDAMR